MKVWGWAYQRGGSRARRREARKKRIAAPVRDAPLNEVGEDIGGSSPERGGSTTKIGVIKRKKERDSLFNQGIAKKSSGSVVVGNSQMKGKNRTMGSRKRGEFASSLGGGLQHLEEKKRPVKGDWEKA